jgi:glycosyltransferase involved in cell wall biosynthesis
MEPPRVSIIVPTYRMEMQLSECLACLSKQTYRDFQIIVVDNNVSTDEGLSVDVEALVSEFASTGLRVVGMACRQAGSYHARKAGVKHSHSELIAFTDADCKPLPCWLESAVAAWDAHPKPGVVSGPVMLYAADQGPVALYEIRHSYLGMVNSSENACITANWLMSRKIHDELNGFNTSLKSGADVELSRRIKAAGYDLVYASGMIVNHPTRTSLDDLLNKHRRTLGGAWSRTPKLMRTLRVLRHVIRRGWTRYRAMLQDPEGSPELAAGLLKVQRAITVAEIRETVRLACGGEPQR